MNMKEKLESLGRNSFQLKIARKETYKLGATRFGGKPDVPPDFVWPTYEGESYDNVVKDRPLTFLAQFNCAELAQFDKEHLLPDHGECCPDVFALIERELRQCNFYSAAMKTVEALDGKI